MELLGGDSGARILEGKILYTGIVISERFRM